MSRRRRSRKQQGLRTGELKDQAREVAGHSGEALKDFAESTGVAAKEFAGRTRDAAKDMVTAIEKAAKGAQVKEEPRRGRRLIKFGLVVGVGVALLANERVRKAISSVTGGGERGPDYPEIWKPEDSAAGNGEAQTAAVAEESG